MYDNETFYEAFSKDLNRARSNVVIESPFIAINQMDDMLYDDKLAGLISGERSQTKHESCISEINDLQKQKGGISQKYEEKYMNGISEIGLAQDAKRLSADEK